MSHKLKCDASKKGSLESCSRCGRLHLQCVVSKSFRRVKRRTYVLPQLLYLVVGLLYESKSELQAEVDSLRQRVQEGRVAENSEGRSSIHGPSPRSSDTNNDAHGANSAPSSMPHIGPESILNINHLQDNINQSLPDVPRAVTEVVSNLGPEATIPQTLDNLSVGAEEIDDCFKLCGNPRRNVLISTYFLRFAGSYAIICNTYPWWTHACGPTNVMLSHPFFSGLLLP